MTYYYIRECLIPIMFAVFAAKFTQLHHASKHLLQLFSIILFFCALHKRIE